MPTTQIYHRGLCKDTFDLNGDKLYHYTTNSGFIGILSSLKLWATKIQYLNDSEELSYAVSMAKDLSTHALTFLSEPIKEKLDRISGINVCTFSLTENGDLLSQWRGYAHSMGYAIGFDKISLQKMLGSELILSPCIYDHHQQKEVLVDLIKGISSDYVNEIGQLFSNDAVNKYVNIFVQRFLEIAPTIKHPGFEEEKEWRIITKPINSMNENWKVRSGKYSLIPYYEISIEQLPIVEIIVAPTPHHELAMQAVCDALESNKFDTKIRILPSKIPFRDF